MKTVSRNRHPLVGFLACVLLVSGFFSAYGAESPADRFDAANLLYEKGDYEQAARAYEAMLSQGIRTSALLFNAGDARYKAGQIGRGVAHWLEAQSIDPRNDRIQINLDFVRKSIYGGTVPFPLWPAQLRILTLNEWATLLLLAGWLFFGALALATWRPKLAPFLRLPIVGGGVVMLVILVLLTITARDRAASTVAVVVSGEAVVRFGPYTESPSKLVVHDGAEFLVTDRKDDWLNVEDALGRSGWLPDEQVILLRAGREIHISQKDRSLARIADAVP